MSNAFTGRDVFGLRQRLSDKVARFVDWRINHVLSIERVNGYDGRLIGHTQWLEDLDRRLREVERKLGDVAFDFERMVPHVAAQDARLDTLNEQLAGAPAADRPQVDEARSLIDEVRREHAQVRVRLTGVAQYEERLRRIEGKLEEATAER